MENEIGLGKSYSCYYFKAKTCPSIYQQGKNAATKNIFFSAALSIPHLAIFYTTYYKEYAEVYSFSTVWVYL